MSRFLFLLVFTISFTADAVVIRHDVDDSRYRVPASEFPALADMPGEGHGVLIAPQWIVTAAHVIPQHGAKEIMLNGTLRKVERLIVYPGYKRLPQALIDEALASGDASKALEFLAASDDIALVKLAAPVTDVAPATIYRGKVEQGMLVKIVGKGGTGNGIDGMGMHDSHRTDLRRAFNSVASNDGRWIGYEFDAGASALELEGMSANGDSGGPVLVEADGQWQVASLNSWKSIVGKLSEFRTGVYGQTSYGIHLQPYAGWIETSMSSQPDEPPSPGTSTSPAQRR